MALRSRTIHSIGEDVLHNILARLPALSFASASCVARSWNRVCNQILCRPKLSSACSFNPSLHLAIEEVVNKVLSKPIRPHFAIVSIGHSFSLQDAHQLITAKLGSEAPIITHCSSGVIGRDAFSNEFKELKILGMENRSIMLMVGFLPGMKVKTISLQRELEDGVAVMIDKFITDIREFSSSVSGCESPAAIIMFSGHTADCLPDLRVIVENIDYAMSPETVIVGECFNDFQHTTGSSRNMDVTKEHVSAGVALVFVMDRNKPYGIGETQFHAVLSSRLLPEGPAYEVASIREIASTYTVLTANEDLGDLTDWRRACIGITKRRLDSTGQEKVNLSFHKVVGPSEEDRFVLGCGIKIGDTFRMYRPNPTTALTSAANVSNHLRSLKQGSGDKREVLGGLIFTSSGLDESYLGEPNVYSSVVLDNFPGVTIGGSFCGSEFGRGPSTLYFQESQEQNSVRCCVSEYGAVYLIMSYIP